MTTHSTAHAHADLSAVGATDHHAAPVTGPDADTTIDTAGAAGTAGAFARSGHGHRLNTYSSAAAALGTAAAGTSGTAPSRGDHVHNHGTGTVANAHAHADLSGIGENDHGRWTAIVVKPSDESVATSTAMQNDDDFFFATVDLAHYEFEMVILYINTAGSTGDLKMDFGEDGNNRGAVMCVGINSADAAAVQSAITNQTGTIVLGAATGERTAVLRGAFRGAGGTWRMRWAQNSSSGTTKVLAGSVFSYRRVV